MSKPLKVLIVDDDPHIRRLLKIYLRSSELAEAATGEEAIALFETSDFDLVLLDLILPYYGGLRLCQKFKSKTRGRKPYVVIMTGDDSSETRDNSVQAGADEFLAKPFSAEQFREVVARAGAVRN